MTARILSIILLPVFFFYLENSFSCTIFKSPFKADPRISHNIDWFEQYPNVKGVLVMNPSRMKKMGELMGAPVKPAEWVSKFKSVSFSITGAEFPVSGFNEKGLSMGVLELPESQFPPASDPRPGLGMAQFVQYNLDTAETIDQVIAADAILRPYSGVFKMHFFVCDAHDKCAVLQYMGGKLNVYRGHDLPYNILTNKPYPESATAAKLCTDQSCSTADNALWRFSQTALLQSKMQANDTYLGQAFNILDKVAQFKGGITKFQITYDPKNLAIRVRKKDSKDFADLKVDFTNLNCHDARRVIPINEASAGDVSKSWQDLKEADQTDMAERIGLPHKFAVLYGKYPFESVSCE